LGCTRIDAVRRDCSTGEKQMQIRRIETGFVTVEMEAREVMALAEAAERAKMHTQEEWQWSFLDTAGSALELAGRVASLAGDLLIPEAERMLDWMNRYGDRNGDKDGD